MTAWTEFSAADFSAALAQRGAAKRAAEAARAGQAGLFFVATPARAAKPATAPGRLPGEIALFGEDDSPATDGHMPDQEGSQPQ